MTIVTDRPHRNGLLGELDAEPAKAREPLVDVVDGEGGEGEAARADAPPVSPLPRGSGRGAGVAAWGWCQSQPGGPPRRYCRGGRVGGPGFAGLVLPSRQRDVRQQPSP